MNSLVNPDTLSNAEKGEWRERFDRSRGKLRDIPQNYSQTISGIFNGTKRTFVGFAFKNDKPIHIMPKPSTFHTLGKREIPTVFVQMDLNIGCSVSKTKKTTIPFVAVCKMDENCL